MRVKQNDFTVTWEELIMSEAYEKLKKIFEEAGKLSHEKENTDWELYMEKLPVFQKADDADKPVLGQGLGALQAKMGELDAKVQTLLASDEVATLLAEAEKNAADLGQKDQKNLRLMRRMHIVQKGVGA